jgi:hypothetical protein
MDLYFILKIYKSDFNINLMEVSTNVIPVPGIVKITYAYPAV